VTGLLFVLAFDHRTSLMRSFFQVEGTPGEQDEARARTAKSVIWEGLRRAVGDAAVAPSEAAALVDTTYGADVVRAAKEEGIRVAVPVEASGRKELAFELPDWRDRLEALRPDWAKVLVRYNPDGDAEMNERQLGRLKRLSDWLHANDRTFLFELLVPAEPAQLESVGGDTDRYDAELRPELMRRAIEAIQNAGIEVDIWKIEGVDAQTDAQMLAEQARSGEGRENVVCVLLGRGASDAKVDHWLREAAPVDGFVGFAIGRSIWWDALRGFLDGSVARADAASQIAENYLRFIRVYERQEVA
jgi:myo-inositol catabolism protein IolC